MTHLDASTGGTCVLRKDTGTTLRPFAPPSPAVPHKAQVTGHRQRRGMEMAFGQIY